MLFSKKTAAAKRASFRDELSTGRLLQFPGAHAPIVSLIIQEQGFDGVYISGAALSADLGLPDIGLTTLTEVSQRGRQISRVTDLPALIDIDTGFGEPMSAARSVQEFEELGLARCHLEDQVNPKRCGHLDNKSIVSVAEMTRKLRAASDAKKDTNFLIMARTDARASEGLEAAIDRCKAYIDAGADAIFPEALQGWEEYEKVREAIDVPILANLTEFGKTPLLTKTELENLGYNIAIYPVTSLRLSMKAVEEGFSAIRQQGTQKKMLDRLQTRTRLYELIHYEDYNKFDEDIFNFGTDGHGSE